MSDRDPPGGTYPRVPSGTALVRVFYVAAGRDAEAAKTIRLVG